MYKDDILFEIHEYGKYNYNIDQIVILMDGRIDEKQFRKDFKNRKSDLYKRYQLGVMEAAVEIDKALHKAAKKGDVQAIEMIRMRKMINEEG